MTSVMAVLNHVKDLQVLITNMQMPIQQMNVDVLSSQSKDEICGNISSFWIKSNPHWHQLKKALSECNEMEAVAHVELMEVYNREGKLTSYSYR